MFRNKFFLEVLQERDPTAVQNSNISYAFHSLEKEFLIMIGRSWDSEQQAQIPVAKLTRNGRKVAQFGFFHNEDWGYRTVVQNIINFIKEKEKEGEE
jgi:hypothetical protein